MKKRFSNTFLFLTLITIPHLLSGQNTGYNLSLMDDMDFQNFLTDINVNSADLTKYYDGSVYLFKEPKEAVLYFWNEKARNATAFVNLNIQKNSFDFTVNDKTFSFSAQDLREVVIDEVSFVPNDDGVFNKIIFSNDATQVVEEFRLEIQEQSHVIGYETKKNDIIKVKKSTFLVANNQKTSFSRTKKGVSKLFGKKAGEVKTYLSTQKLSPKSDADLARVFSQFAK